MNDNHHKFYDDDGTEVNPDLIPKPLLCISCKKDGIRNEEILCNLNRMDQLGDDEFICGAYEPSEEESETEI
jgi:hypothetical protein